MSGTVVDERDHPRAGARVTVSGKGSLEATSSPDGRFVVAAPLGSYTVRASAPHTLKCDGVAATVDAAKTTEVQIRLWSAVSLEGVVVDGTGAPIRWSEIWSQAVVGRSAKAVQPKIGHFEIDGLLPGPHRIAVRADGFANREFDVTAPSKELRLVMEPGLTVLGMVLDESGNPLADAEVGLLPEGKPLGASLGGTADEDGAFKIDGVQPGRYLAVAAESLRNEKYSTTGASVSEKIAVFETNTRVTLRFKSGEVIRGTVVDSHGRPIAGAIVSALPDGVGPVQGLAANLQRSETFADGKGAFTLTRLHSGRYRVWAEYSGYSNRNDSMALATTGDSSVRLALSEEGIIRGRVLHADGSPSLEYRLNDQTIRSSDGRFAYSVHSGPTVTLFFNESNYAQEVRLVQAGREKEVTLEDVVLTPARRIDGEVIDASSGQPVVNASVCLADKDLPSKELGSSLGAVWSRRSVGRQWSLRLLDRGDSAGFGSCSAQALPAEGVRDQPSGRPLSTFAGGRGFGRGPSGRERRPHLPHRGAGHAQQRTAMAELATRP
ncbi:MAG: carboxypeptidase-like regulatory domain-containing protein [Myxococcales bacterium]